MKLLQMADRTSGRMGNNMGGPSNGCTLQQVWAVEGNLAQTIVALAAEDTLAPQQLPANAVRERTAALANVASSGSATDLSGLAASATVDTTNAANITSGTIAPARLPTGTTSQIGAVKLGVDAEQAITEVIFATLPTTNLYPGRKVTMTDGVAGSGCTAGGGTIPKFCRCDGTGWKVLGVNPLEKNVANGIVGLDAGAMVPVAQLPAAAATTQGAVKLAGGAASNQLAASATTDTTTSVNVKRNIGSLTPNLGAFPITVPTTTVFCFEGDSTSAGGQGSPANSPISTIFAKTPIGAAVAANGATHIANYAVAGQSLSTINGRYATSCHLVRPGVTLADGTVVGTAYFVFWSYWNNESTSPAGNISRTQLEYAYAKADGFIVVGATAMQDPAEVAGTEPQRQQFNAQLRALKNFYNNTTVSACVTANVCGYDYLDDLDALIPELKQPFQTNADGLTISYPLVATDGRHPSDVAAYLEMSNLNNLLQFGDSTLPKGAMKPYGEVSSTSATAVIPPFATLATITLSANYSPTWAAPPNPLSSPRECVQFAQDATGGRTVTWPANVLGGFTVGSIASKRSQQCFQWSPTQTAWVAESNGITNY